MDEGRKLMRYAMYKVDAGFRLLPDEERTLAKKEFADLISSQPETQIHTYSTVGLRADTDFVFWEIANSAQQIQELQSRINGTALARWLREPFSYIAMSRKSQYTKGHKHEGQEAPSAPGPVGASFLFVYPMDKLRPWYRLDFEERRRIMGEHFRIGHKYPNIKIHTGYSFGIDDQEFVVAFEGESMGEFLDLVEELRGSESSAYTARDVPIFTCLRLRIEDILDQIDGHSAQ